MDAHRWLLLLPWRFWAVLPLLATLSWLPVGIQSTARWLLWLVLLSALSPIFSALIKAWESQKVAATFDPKLEKLQTNRYEDLTAAELVSMLEGATRLRVQGDEDRAERIMRASLDLEHFISVVPLDPAQVPQQTLDEIRKQRDDLVAMIGRSIPLHLFGERVSDQVAEG